MVATAVRPPPATDTFPSALQLEVLRGLALPATRLRWYSYTDCDRKQRGRGQVLGSPSPIAGRLLPSHTVRKLIRGGYIEPVDAHNRVPFSAGGAHRDYHLTGKGRAFVILHPGATP